MLGHGTFGKVNYARNQEGDIDHQIGRHPYIIHLYAKGGELFNKVAKGKLQEDLARKFFRQLINAVDFCHSRGVYHRDLKPENILLDEDENLKISDFGLSALVESWRQDGLLHTACGTPAYVAPEVISRKGYDVAVSDICSCGVILCVLLSGYLPFHSSNLMELYRKIGKADYKSKIKESTWFRTGWRPESEANEAESSDEMVLVHEAQDNKKDAGLFKFEGAKEGRKGYLSIDAEIYMLTPAFHLVQVKKTGGDSLEYQKVFDEGIRPGLEDVVWAWEGESQPRLEPGRQQDELSSMSSSQERHSEQQ
ncbi:hypothetical protein SASPL_105092 [Salvia splendens]|uniref:Protein kinase domain-containing protein n=1 Tax=Salvia splendens TaxID=180675 RepID=A0A8X8YIN6_SALSN|nr:hypothetical protein SASPL_105092 [Salvia splendens]